MSNLEDSTNYLKFSNMTCAQTNVASAILKNAISNSGVGKETTTKLLNQLDETKAVDGKVILVQTNQKDRVIVVGPGSNLISFNFPKNGKDFETELIRAQMTERTVTVIYNTDKDGTNSIISVLLYGGPALGGS